ncbi:hypothetical protein [Methanobrevibacter olleyae]|uniref:PMBR domain-containing protein n=1 Tax=Methanobrevibacter olleyae TaxID=294671 RepID=A0A126R2S0_METOL|nr:hypothetical protein [Methanobrevibacter olleyae]AMK16336.1 PMBR domain-containing protein [Methanobrevibacter olleyae]
MKYKIESLLNESKEIKEFIEKKHKIPISCKLSSGEVLSPFSVAYLLSKIVSDKFMKKEYDLINVRIYNNKKYVDTINENVVKDDYIVMINNFLLFCNKKHRVPNYITTQKTRTKVSFELFLYCLSKIIVFYQNNKRLPLTCNFNKSILSNTVSNNKITKKVVKQSTSTKPKSVKQEIYNSTPHPTRQGCGGMGQDTSYYCGVSALQKVLFKFGISDFSQKTLATWAATTTKGTSHQGIRTAVEMVNKKKGTQIKVTEKTFKEAGGWKGIGKIIANPKQDIIFHNCYRLKYGHYEVVNQINITNNVEKVLNSLGDKCTSSCYCGYIESRSAAEFKKYLDAISQKSLIILTKE